MVLSGFSEHRTSCRWLNVAEGPPSAFRKNGNLLHARKIQFEDGADWANVGRSPTYTRAC